MKRLRAFTSKVVITAAILLSARLTDNNSMMIKFVWRSAIAIVILTNALALAQSPTPSPTTAPPSPTLDDVINSLGQADLQAALSLIKSNFTNPDAINETELNRATLQGLLIRQPGGVMILMEHEAAAPDAPLYGEILEGHVAYLRPGSLTSANLKAMDRKLGEFSGKKTDALILDLRASLQASDFAAAAEFAKRFCPKGKKLFTVRKTAVRQDRTFDSDRDPSFQGMVVVLVDGDTAGGGETIAADLRTYDRALIIGQPSAGRAVEYTDSALPNGKILRVASAEAVMPDGQSLFPDGVKPDLPVQMSLADKRQIFQLSNEKGMTPFIYEAERPHLNEAALLAGTNPELDATETQRRPNGKGKQPARDPVLQRALDVLTSLEIYQNR
jgi:Peptidase family S41